MKNPQSESIWSVQITNLLILLSHLRRLHQISNERANGFTIITHVLFSLKFRSKTRLSSYLLRIAIRSHAEWMIINNIIPFSFGWDLNYFLATPSRATKNRLDLPWSIRWIWDVNAISACISYRAGEFNDLWIHWSRGSSNDDKLKRSRLDIAGYVLKRERK